MAPILAVLIIIFVLLLLECLLRKRVSYIVTNLDVDEEAIEVKIRDIIYMHPNSEIIVFCTPKNPEYVSILNKLQDEFSQLHIVK